MQVTVVVPRGKVEFGAGLQIVVAPGQLSIAVGTVKLTIFEPEPGELSPVEMFDGQVTVGFSVSLTVTVNIQVGPAVDKPLTVVVPWGKNEPDAGEQLTVPHSGVRLEQDSSQRLRTGPGRSIG